ncbi:Hypothetical predicted protein [Mytilus galloprovincialis]|uniref:Uncharacterized protein n=1 Tax=Mytilus galloprovincialis TaxID=29158 RepID=A0A8B6BQ22_MYTGA|nr:Hypothetical predicted protein [Mytilus galloprovincialis]
MQTWLNKSKDTYRTLEEYEQGWKEGTKFDGPPGEELFQPVYSGDEKRAASSYSMDMDITIPVAWRITKEAQGFQSTVHPRKTTQPKPTYIPTPTQLLATIITEDVPNIELRTPAERATSLIRLWGMPLFPLAWRDWTGEVQVSNHPNVPRRAGLLDKYNMFALPETSTHNKIKDLSRTIIKNRVYMFENLRLIATDGIKPDLSTTFMLNMLEKASASRDKSTDHNCHALDKAGIPLRLDV